MRRESQLRRSRILDREVPVLRYGVWGPPLVYFSTSGGDHTEFERYGMHADCAAWIDSGKLQVFVVDARGPHTLYSDALSPRDRIDGYARFERHAAEEVLPWVAEAARNDFLCLLGASYGAYVAANLLFKRPDEVRLACGLGGVYAHRHRLGGFHDDTVYTHTPPEYLPDLEDGERLEAIRATRGIQLYAAANDEWLDSTLRMATVLKEKRLPHRVEILPAPADHHERWWKIQLRHFLRRHYGPV